MTPKQLRQAVLQLAIQGKLLGGAASCRSSTPQCVPVKCVPATLERQDAAPPKRRSRGNKNAFPPISPEEIPFEIPNHWEWRRLGEVGELQDGEKMEGKSFPYLDAKFLRGKKEGEMISSGKYISAGTLSQQAAL